MTSIADALACDASNVTGIVDRLETRGLIARGNAAHDRRIKTITLTTHGKDVLDQLTRGFLEPPKELRTLPEPQLRRLRDIVIHAFGHWPGIDPNHRHRFLAFVNEVVDAPARLECREAIGHRVAALIGVPVAFSDPARALATASRELRVDLHSFRVIARDSGPVNYYSLVDQAAWPYIHAAYRPPYETTVLGYAFPEQLRGQSHRYGGSGERWSCRVVVTNA
jgi:DNA-binding MarR family transcriptional regulator